MNSKTKLKRNLRGADFFAIISRRQVIQATVFSSSLPSVKSASQQLSQLFAQSSVYRAAIAVDAKSPADSLLRCSRQAPANTSLCVSKRSKSSRHELASVLFARVAPRVEFACLDKQWAVHALM